MTTARAQQNLKAAGYDPGPADGVLGPRTIGALCAAALGPGETLPPAVGAALWPWMKRFGITTPERMVNLIANCGWESRFRLVEENLNYSAKRLTQVWPGRFPTLAAAGPYAGDPERLANVTYGGRMGNTQPGDGWRYRGRGWPQLTGRETYRDVGDIVGLPFEAEPDRLLTYDGSAAATVGFWEWKGLSPLADAGMVASLRRRWNGGEHGQAQVQAIVSRLLGFWA